VDVVGHEGPGKEGSVGIREDLFKSTEKVTTVIIVAEDVHLVKTAEDGVIQKSWEVGSWSSGHDKPPFDKMLLFLLQDYPIIRGGQK